MVDYRQLLLVLIFFLSCTDQRKHKTKFVERVKSTGTCIPYGLIPKLDVLQNCKDIYGSLEFQANASGPQTDVEKWPYLNNIVGCVYIRDTKLFHLEFLRNAIVNCTQKDGSIIQGNPNLCATKEFQQQLRKNGITTVDVKYTHCPACTPESHNMSQLESCGSYTKSLIWNYTQYRFPIKLKHVEGRLIFKDIKLPDNLDFDMTVDAYEHSEPSVSFANTSVPPETIFKKLQVRTYARASLEIVNITGYRMPREVHTYLSDEFYPKQVDADVEKDDECYLPETKKTFPFKMHGLLNCKRLYGHIDVNTDDHYGNADVYFIESVYDVKIKETDGDLTTVFKNMVKLVLKRNANIILTLRDKVCFKADVMKMVKGWLPLSQYWRVKYHNPNCGTFIGPITMLDLIWEGGKQVKEILGTFQLSDLKMHFENETTREKDRFEHSLHRFNSLATILKTESIPFQYPAFEIKMCNTRIDLPSLLFSVNISSQRDDDMLIKVRGFNYRMNQTAYELLEKKYGKERLDIEKQFDTDCVLKNPIKDLSVLDGCERIVGDFFMNGTVSGKTTTKIKHISGCLQIIRTNLQLLDFFEFDEPYDPSACQTCSEVEHQFAIKNNSDLCVTNSMFDVDYELISNNAILCESNENTISVVESVVVYGPFNPDNYSRLSRIAELDGKIVITQTDAEYMNLFPSLEKINYVGKGAAIVIENNENLKEFVLPSLKEIKVSGQGQAILIRNNPRLILTEKDIAEFKRLSGNFSVTVDNEEEYDEKRYDMWKGIGIGAGAASGATVGATLLIVIIVAVVHSVRRKSMKKNGKKDKKGKKRDANLDEGKMKKNDSKTRSSGNGLQKKSPAK